MKRAHWLWCGGGLLALVVVLLVAGAPAVSALLLAALLDRTPGNSSRLSPSQMSVDRERSLR
jgi:hypothetical protein